MVDIDNTSRIVLSFNNANGGHLFAHWLRNELMKALGYFAQDSVYLDNVAVRSNSSSGPKEMDTIRHTGLEREYWNDPRKQLADMLAVPLVGPNKFGGPNYQTIGAMHIAWEEMWANALKTSKVLIQLQTQAYLDASKKQGSPCERELARINAALEGGSINVLAIRFNDVPDIAIALKTGARTTPMLCTKVDNKHGGAFSDAYKLSASDLARVVKFCKSKGC